jgi:peptide/nickel transport system permease protein
MRFRSFSFTVGAVMLILAIVGAAAAPYLPLPDPVQPSLPSFGEPFPPQRRCLCGTDELGRDVCSRLIYAARLSLPIAIGAAFASTFLGTLVGLLAGGVGGAVDTFLMRLTDVVLSFPVLLLAMGLAALFEPSVGVLLLVIFAVGWTTIARAVRAEVQSLARREYIEAARALGSSRVRIFIRHILPAIRSTILALWAITASHALLIDAGLSFIGLGVPPPAPSWGRMLSESQAYYRIAPWLMVFPGAALVYSVAAFQLLAWGLARHPQEASR